MSHRGFNTASNTASNTRTNPNTRNIDTCDVAITTEALGEASQAEIDSYIVHCCCGSCDL